MFLNEMVIGQYNNRAVNEYNETEILEAVLNFNESFYNLLTEKLVNEHNSLINEADEDAKEKADDMSFIAKVKKFFVNLWKAIKSAFEKAWKYITELFSKLFKGKKNEKIKIKTTDLSEEEKAAVNTVKNLIDNPSVIETELNTDETEIEKKNKNKIKINTEDIITITPAEIETITQKVRKETDNFMNAINVEMNKAEKNKDVKKIKDLQKKATVGSGKSSKLLNQSMRLTKIISIIEEERKNL